MKIDHVDTFNKLVSQLQTEGGIDNQLLLSTEKGYCLIKGKKGQSGLEIEISNGRALKQMDDLKNPQIIKELGFRARRTLAENDKRELHFDDVEMQKQWFKKLWGALPLIFKGRHHPIFAKLFLGDHLKLDNQSILDGMKALSKERSFSARQKVYWRLARGEFLLALRPESDFYSLYDDLKVNMDEDQIESDLQHHFLNPKLYLMSDLDQMQKDLDPMILDKITGYPSIGIFTDMHQLKLFEPRGLPYLKLTGSLLIYYFLQKKFSSLLINPRGEIGGELYQNEISSIYEIISQTQGHT
jgi:hypothetical protein